MAYPKEELPEIPAGKGCADLIHRYQGLKFIPAKTFDMRSILTRDTVISFMVLASAHCV